MQLFYANESNPTAFMLTLIIGFVLSIVLAVLGMRRQRLKPRTGAVALILSVVLGWLLSHLLYCLVQLDNLIYDIGLVAFIDFSWEYYLLYGGIIGVALGLFLAAKFCGDSFGKLLDCFAPAGFLFVAAVRVAEGFAGQGYGEYFWEENAFCRFPFAVFDPVNEMWAWALFLLEAVFALAIVVILLLTKPKKPAGDKALLGLGLYACGQVLFESLRRDNFLRWGFVRCSELFSGVAILLVLICYLVRAREKKNSVLKALFFVLFLLMAALCLLLEFATEGRIDFLLFLETPAQCYLGMAAACLVMIVCVAVIRAMSYTINLSEEE